MTPRVRRQVDMKKMTIVNRLTTKTITARGAGGREYQIQPGPRVTIDSDDVKKSMFINSLDGHKNLAKAGLFQPNPWGLYDMHGNVWEWCGDRYTSESLQPGFPRRRNDRYAIRGGCYI